MAITINPLIIKALSDSSVKGNLNRFKSDQCKLRFFSELVRSRNINDMSYEDVLDMVRDASLYTLNTSVKDIEESINFYKYKPNNLDMQRQKYDVYISPKSKD